MNAIEPRLCGFCYAPESESNPLTIDQGWVGGVGWVTTGPACRDAEACWARMEANPRPVARREEGRARNES
jgi:hypothetical protein